MLLLSLLPRFMLLLLLLLPAIDSSLLYSQEQVDDLAQRYEQTISELRERLLTEKSALPPPLHQLRGVLSLPGNKHVRVPHEVIQGLERGDWSVSFWMRITSLVEDDNNLSGNGSGVPIQTLLHKGGDDGSSTPTCYLEAAKSSAGELALHRIVFKTDQDTFADRYIDPDVVALDKWQMYTFTFANLSQAGGEFSYSTSLYIDDVLRLRVDYREPVFANTHALLLFQSGYHERGVARALARGVSIYGQALSVEQVVGLFTTSQHSPGRDVAAVDAALAVLTQARREGGVSMAAGVDGSPGGETARALLNLAKNSTNSCSSIDFRSELYAAAAVAGSVDALRAWAMLLSHGYEGGEIQMCGLRASQAAASSPSASIASRLSNVCAGKEHSEHGLAGGAPPLLALFEAAARGSSAALMPIAAYVSGGVLTAEVLAAMLRSYSRLRKRLPLPADSADEPPHCLAQLQRALSSGAISKESASLGLVFLAAVGGAPDAYMVLASTYHKGNVLAGVKKDAETGLYYAMEAAAAAAELFNHSGNELLAQSDLLDDDTAEVVSIGNRGDDDLMIQTQRIQADEGDVPSMLRTADLLYYGGRGMARDQPAALRYYQQAAMAGDPLGMCGAAAMLIKGEGGAKNATASVDLYSRAAALGLAKARNGLGFLYFHGDADGVPANKTKAFELFSAAADTKEDADSLLNAGQCLEFGWGVEKDMSRALAMYSNAARLFGHFHAMHSLARLHGEGAGVHLARSAGDAVHLYMQCAGLGPTLLWTRRGLDQYLLGQHSRALSCYMLYAAAHITSARNAEFLLRRRRSALLASQQGLFSSPQQAVGAHAAALASLASRDDAESLFHLGTAHYRGDGVYRSAQTAAAYYSQAAAKGHPLAAVYLGVMHQFGLGGLEESDERSGAYYSQAQQTLGSLSSGAHLRPLVAALQAMQGGGVVAAYVARPLMAAALRQLWGA